MVYLDEDALKIKSQKKENVLVKLLPNVLHKNNIIIFI